MLNTKTASAVILAFALIATPLLVKASQSDTPAPTKAAVQPTETKKDPSDFAIWLGEVELRGNKVIWVELIDGYGEVVYESQVKTNETHVLPDGRAIVVRNPDGGDTGTKRFTDRVNQDNHLVVTRRVVTGKDGKTSVEFVEEKSDRPDTALVTFAKAGNWVWSQLTAFFSATFDTVRVAWSALTDVIGV